MLDEILKVVPSGALMKGLIGSIKINLEDAVSQFENGKNEGAAAAVGKAKYALDQLEDIFDKVYTD